MSAFTAKGDLGRAGLRLQPDSGSKPVRSRTASDFTARLWQRFS